MDTHALRQQNVSHSTWVLSMLLHCVVFILHLLLNSLHCKYTTLVKFTLALHKLYRYIKYVGPYWFCHQITYISNSLLLFQWRAFVCCKWMFVCVLLFGCTLCLPSPDVLVHDQCVSEASLCQAVEMFSLALTCSPCNDNDVVTWFFSSGHQQTKNNTLWLPAVNVTKNASGCYRCQCGSGEGIRTTYFSVQVDQPGMPTWF